MNAPQKNFEQARYGVDSYKDWLKAEGLKVVEGLAIDCTQVETAEWPRVGTRAAALHLDGRGDFCNMLLYELGPGKSTLPQRHLFEEVIYVVEGVGSTQLELPSGERRSFEWGPTSLFAIPLNAKYRHFNSSGVERAVLVSTTNLPMMLNLFHNEKFVFDNNFDFDDRLGKQGVFRRRRGVESRPPGQRYLGNQLRSRSRAHQASRLLRPRRRRRLPDIPSGR